MSKKVLMFAMPVHPIPPLKGAAVETWMYEVSKRLLSFEPHIISIGTPYYSEKEYKDGIYFHRINFSSLYKRIFQKMTKLDPLSYPKRILRIINEVNPDIVHIHNTFEWALPVIQKLNKEIKTILHFHNEINVDKEILIDAFAGCSNYITELHKKNSKIKAKQYKCLYNGVDLGKFKPYWEVLEIRENIRKRFNIKNNEFVVLFVGRVSPEKGVEHFIDIAIRFRDVKNIKFFIIGEISKKGSRYEYAKGIIQKASSLKDKIIFTDVFPPSKMHLIYLIGDVIILPSNFEEPFGMVAIEAMASGLPVIARQKGGLKEFIKDGVNGFFIKEDRIIENSLNLIQDLINDKNLRERISRNGRETVEKFFSWDKIAENTENFYRELLGTDL
jgi:UDP-N-acetylglucosamine:(glucosyl)LPS alpha-1,2-N-acetylglucosaminyltransferase